MVGDTGGGCRRVSHCLRRMRVDMKRDSKEHDVLEKACKSQGHGSFLQFCFDLPSARLF